MVDSDVLNFCMFLLLLLNVCVSLSCYCIDFNILKNICGVSVVNGNKSRNSNKIM